VPEMTTASLGKLKRLIAMPPAEIAFRIREKSRSQVERLGLHAPPTLPGGPDFKGYLAGAVAQRFYPCHTESARELLRQSFPHWVSTAVNDAESLCEHEIPLLHLGVARAGREIDWHRDPFSGQRWERHFWTNYQPEHDAAGRDPKVIHELNRHQHLPRLAKAYFLTGNERYAAEAKEQLLGWIEQNPPGVGINWQSSLEIAIRCLSWMWTLFPILTSRALDASSAQRIGTSLFAQLDHVHRHTSFYSSPNTHLIGEAAALFIGGLLFCDWKPGMKWLETGAAVLIQEADRQFLEDGVHAELSTYYHCYAVDFYLQALTLAQHNNCYLPDSVYQKLEDALTYVMHVTRPDGTIPLLGDDDGGRSLALANRNYNTFNDGLCSGAVLFQRKDFKGQSGGFAEETFWLTGEKGWDSYRRLESRLPAENSLFTPSAGYYIHRSGWGQLDTHLIFDCGGLGMLTGGHSHADALAVTLFDRGREMLVDPGTFVYNAAEPWRRYFRSTAAHNTVGIDGQDQATMGGTFRWNSRIIARATDVQHMPVGSVQGEHEWSNGVIHRRRIVNVEPGQWLLLDDFRGPGRHTFDFAFHFGPEFAPSFEHQDANLVCWVEHDDFMLAMAGSAGFEAEMVRGNVAPIQGWTSSGYGDKKPGSTLSAKLTGSAPAAMMTLLAPRAEKPVVERLRAEEGDAIAVSFTHGDAHHIAVFCPQGEPVCVAGFRLCGEFFWITMRDNQVVNTVAIHASQFRFGERDLLKDDSCALFVES
jgi:Heparinase II/III-like protein/Heparinase II/III N-terminus